MRNIVNILFVIFLLISVSACEKREKEKKPNNFTYSSNKIEKALQEIKSLEKEIERNEILVEKKIAELKKNNPIFADQDVFESDIEYLTRMSKAMSQINQLRKQYIDGLWQKMSILRGRLFETKNIQIDLDTKNYDPNTEKWQVTLKHLEYQQEKKHITLDISKNDASDLHKNWDKVKKTGLLAIDVGDKIGLAKLLLENPITGFELEYEFHHMKSLKHDYYVISVTFSPDGKFLATGSEYARIFNLETGNEVNSFKHDNYVKSVAFSPDGKFLATGCLDNYAHIFNLDTGKEVKLFKHNRFVNSVTFSPDGRFLATGSYDETASIFNLETGKEVKSFKHDYDDVSSITLSPDGKFLAIGSFTFALIFNLETGNEVKSFEHNYSVTSVAFSPDGKFLAAGSLDDTARIFNLKTGKEVKSFKHDYGVSSVTFSPDGKFLATGSEYARIFNLETGKEVKLFKHDAFISSVTFSPDGKFLAVGCGDHNAYIYRTLIQYR